MSGKGAKGLIMGKSASNNKDKDKKKPVSRSSRAGLQVFLVLMRNCHVLSAFGGYCGESVYLLDIS